MKRIITKKLVSLVITITLAVTIMNPPRETEISMAEEKTDNFDLGNPVMTEEGVTTWDCVYFGNYPQSKYTPQKEPENPVAGKEYSDSDGTKMVYQEWEREEYNKEKYDYEKVKYQGYFKVEPIKWRVLSVDGEDAFLMADSILDSRCFNEKYWEDKNGNGKKEEEEIITWKDSSVRSWLNDEFYQTAFSEEERKSVIEHTIVNEGNNDKKETYNNTFLFPDGGITKDKIFLVSRAEMSNVAYGMSDNAIGQVNRDSQCTDYAKKALQYESEATFWWLRSPQAYFVDHGEVGYAIMMSLDEYPVVQDCWGIRPGLHIDLSRGGWKKTNTLSINAYKKKCEYSIDDEKVILSHMSDGSVWLKIGNEKEEMVDRAGNGIREVGMSHDGAYCTIDREGQAYYGKNYDYEGEYHAIDYLKGLSGGDPWYHRTDSGRIVSSCEDAEDGEEATRFIYDNENYVVGYETNKGKIVSWLSFEEMEALCDARWRVDDDSDVSPSPTPMSKPTQTETSTSNSGEKEISVLNRKKLKTGTTFSDASGAAYKVLTENSVAYIKPVSKSVTKAVIPPTITTNGTPFVVSTIAKNAFSGCTKLKSVSIGKNVTSIGDKAFYNCKALSKIIIPAKVTKIGKQAFAKCKKLKSITIKSSKLTAKSVGAKAFKGIYAKATVKVPKKQKKGYRKLLIAKGMTKKAKIKCS